MSIAQYIKPENIVISSNAGSRLDIFNELVSSLATAGVLENSDKNTLVQKLEEREALSTTGVGEGIAIPHASLSSIKETVIALGISRKGIDFSSVDGAPVDVIFMIIGSQNVPRQHIQILAKIVRLCKNKDLMKTIRSGATQKEILEAIRMVET